MGLSHSDMKRWPEIGNIKIELLKIHTGRPKAYWQSHVSAKMSHLSKQQGCKGHGAVSDGLASWLWLGCLLCRGSWPACLSWCILKLLLCRQLHASGLSWLHLRILIFFNFVLQLDVIIIASTSLCGEKCCKCCELADTFELGGVQWRCRTEIVQFNIYLHCPTPSGRRVNCLVHRLFAKRIPRLFVLHVVCTCESVLVTLFLVGANCTRVPIFDVKSTRVAYILAGEVLCFVRLVLASWDGRHKLVTSHIWHGRHVNLGCSPTASSSCSSASASSSASSCCSATSSKLLWGVAIPLLILG